GEDRARGARGRGPARVGSRLRSGGGRPRRRGVNPRWRLGANPQPGPTRGDRLERVTASPASSPAPPSPAPSSPASPGSTPSGSTPPGSTESARPTAGIGRRSLLKPGALAGAAVGTGVLA